jgi:enoyl-CoA hydratase/carnithine racemase
MYLLSLFARALVARLAWEIAKNGPVAVRSAKEAVDTGIEAATLEDALEIERQCYQRVIPTEDRLEGLAAFREGRPPAYKGQ